MTRLSDRQKHRIRYAITNPTRALRRTLRVASSCFRPLPHFIIAGTTKGGTTSLFHYLASHHQINPPEEKEIHYFDKNFDLGNLWYKSHFPTLAHTTRQKTGLTCSGTDRVTKRDPCHSQPRHAPVRISTDSRSFRSTRMAPSAPEADVPFDPSASDTYDHQSRRSCSRDEAAGEDSLDISAPPAVFCRLRV